MSGVGGSDNPGGLPPGNVGKLRAKFEKIDEEEKPEASELPKFAGTRRADTLGGIVKTGTKDEIHTPRSEAEKGLKGRRLQWPLGESLSGIQARFEPREKLPPVLEGSPFGN
ncbi:MAG: hypothetical protein K940chlam7_01786 [Chlamydiae bacterium]|nr:hypothetical protein [Chlamydiota bacterium]